MTVWMRLSVTVLCLALASGCEWSSGGESNSFTGRFNFVNWNGVYRGINGAPVVSDFSGVPGQDVTVRNERTGTANGASTAFSGAVNNAPVVEGTITITVGSFTFSDPEGDGFMSGNPAGSGNIVYGTGAWSIDLAGTAPAAGTPIRASYVYSVAGQSAGAGSSGGRIDSLTIFQEGNKLTIRDSLGATYSGRLGSIRASSNQLIPTSEEGQQSEESIPRDIIAQYSVQGVNKANKNVTMAGVFTGTVEDGGRSLARRVIEGTYVEGGGKVGDVLGTAPTIGVDATAITIPGELGTETP